MYTLFSRNSRGEASGSFEGKGKNMATRERSADSGQFVPKGTEKKDPTHTVKETIKPTKK